MLLLLLLSLLLAEVVVGLDNVMSNAMTSTTYHAVYRRSDIQAPVLVNIVSPPPFALVTSKDYIIVSVEGMTLGEGTGSLVIGDQGQMQTSSISFSTNISISRFFKGYAGSEYGPELLDLEIAAASGDGELLLTPGSIAPITLWVSDYVQKAVDLPFWGVNASLINDIKKQPIPPRRKDQPVVNVIHWVYPGSTGVDVLSKNGMRFCFNIDIPADYVYLSAVPNPTPEDLKYMPIMFRYVAAKQHHSVINSIHCMSLDFPGFKERMGWGHNSFHVWASGRLETVDCNAGVSFMAASGEAALVRAFSSNLMFNFAVKATSSENAGDSTVEEGKGTFLIIVEIPPRKGLDTTGDEHAVAVVVGAVKDLGYDFVIVSRICEWYNPTRGEETQAKDKKNMHPYIQARLHCPVSAEDAAGWMRQHQRNWVGALIMSRVWELPHMRSMPDIWIPLLRSCCSSTKVVVWGVDVHAACSPEEHYLRNTPGTYIRQYSQLTSLAWSDAVLTDTPEDQTYLEPILPSWVKVFHAGTTHGISLTGEEIVPGWEHRSGVLLFGAPHIINVESNLWFLCNVWPILKEELIKGNFLSQAIVTVVGMKQADAARYATELGFNMELATTDDIHWMGYVPDINAVFDSARIMATPVVSCPEFCSKNMRALERGLPVVTTERGAQEDQSGRLGVAVSSIFPNEFAELAFSMLTNDYKWTEASRGALQLMAKHFQEKQVRRKIAEAIKQVL